MLPLERLRELLGPDSELSEEELQVLQREMHELAELIVEAAWVTLGSTPSGLTEASRGEEKVEAE